MASHHVWNVSVRPPENLQLLQRKVELLLRRRPGCATASETLLPGLNLETGTDLSVRLLYGCADGKCGIWLSTADVFFM